MKIWYQSAVEMTRATAYRDALNAHFKRVASDGVEVVLHGAKPGFWGELQPALVSGYPYVFHKMVENIFVDAAVQAEKEGYDAFVIGSSTDPALREARSAVDIPVVSMLESSLLVACTVANRIGLIVPTEEVAYILDNNITQARLNGRIATMEVIEPRLADDELNTLFSDPLPFLEKFTATARRAIAARADAVIASEGILAEVIATAGLNEIDGAAIIDPIGTAIVFAEMQVRLRRSTGLRTGRRWHYPMPPKDVAEAARTARI